MRVSIVGVSGLLALGLSGCGSDKEATLAQCELTVRGYEAANRYAARDAYDHVMDMLWDKRTCMRAAGYEWDDTCDEVLSNMSHCYRPAGLVGQAIEGAQDAASRAFK